MKTGRRAADAEREHQEAFGGADRWLVELVDKVRNNDPSLTELGLSGDGCRYSYWGCGHWGKLRLSDLVCELLGRYIAANTHLESFDLPADIEDVSPLFNNLTGSSSLRYLGLNHQRFGLDGIRSMVPFLKNSPNLSQILFGYNGNINSECFEAIVEALNGGHVEKMSILNCRITDTTALGNVTIPYLRELSMIRNDIERVPSLDHLANLQRLWLDHNNIQTMPSIEMLTNLEYLYMNDNRIGNEGCNEIAKLLRSVHSSLKELGLSKNRIGDEGAGILTDSLRGNNTLEKLCLDRNEFNEDGYRAFSRLLNDVLSLKSTSSSNHTLAILQMPCSSSSIPTKLMQHIENAREINKDNKGGPSAAGRAKVIETQLNSTTRKELCEVQGVEYSYGNIFAEIDPILLPNLLALTSEAHGRSELYHMLVATAPDLTSLMGKKSIC